MTIREGARCEFSSTFASLKVLDIFWMKGFCTCGADKEFSLSQPALSVSIPPQFRPPPSRECLVVPCMNSRQSQAALRIHVLNTELCPKLPDQTLAPGLRRQHQAGPACGQPDLNPHNPNDSDVQHHEARSILSRRSHTTVLVFQVCGKRCVTMSVRTALNNSSSISPRCSTQTKVKHLFRRVAIQIEVSSYVLESHCALPRCPVFLCSRSALPYLPHSDLPKDHQSQSQTNSIQQHLL